MVEGGVGGRVPAEGEAGGDVRSAVSRDGAGDLRGDEVGGGGNDVDGDALGWQGGGEGVAGDREVGEAGDGAGGVEPPGLGDAAVGEVREGEGGGSVAGDLLVDRHDREGSVGGALGGEGIDFVGIGGGGGGDRGVAERGALAVVISKHLHGFEDEAGGVVCGGTPAGGEVEAFAAEDAENLGLDDGTGDIVVVASVQGPVVFGDADLGARVVGIDP